MRKIFLISIIFSFLLLASLSLSTETIDCFSFYNFTDSYFVSLHVDKETYKPGDTVRVATTVQNINNYPLPELEIRAYLFYVGDEFVDRIEGNDLISEPIVQEDINLLPGKTYDFNFNWIVPSTTKSGTYMVGVYLYSKNDFVFAGLPFLPEVLGKFATFDVTGGSSSLFHFDKTKVKYNGNDYKFRSIINPVQQLIKVDSVLVNEGDATSVTVTYGLFRWADTNGANSVTRKTENFNLGKGESKQLSYTIDGLPNDVYQLIIIAKTDDGRESIINPRFPAAVEKGNFIFLGLDKFPLSKGDTAKIVSCYSNSAYSSYSGKQSIEIKDKSRTKTYASFSYGPVNYTSSVSAFSEEFKPNSDLTSFRLIGKIFDSNGNLQKQVDVLYDAEKFGLMIEKPKQDNTTLILALAAIILGVIFFGYELYSRRRR